MRDDLRYALRRLRSSPLLTLAVALTLGLGIGASCAIFTVFSSVLLRPLPYPEPDRLVYIKEDLGGGNVIPFAFGLELKSWAKHARSLDGLAAYMDWNANLSGAGEAERVECGAATASLFPLLGVRPAAGRSFLPEEDRPGGTPVAMLSYSLWQRRFGGKAAVIGRAITLDGEVYTIVGVLPAGFTLADRYSFFHKDVWVPLALSEVGRSRFPLLRAVGRLRPGAGVEIASADLNGIMQSVLTPAKKKRRAVVLPWAREVTADVRRPLVVFLAAVGLVLLIACVNVANLQLSRAAGRDREMGIRTALGASGGRIVRQLLIESTTLALLGAVLGLVVAFWSRDLLIAALSAILPVLEPIGFDHRVAGFALAMALLTGIASGLAPALQAARVPPLGALAESSRGGTMGRSSLRMRGLLVITETALAMVLLIGAGLLMKSFLRLRGVDLGFHPERVLTFGVSLTAAQYPTAKEQSRYFEQMIERIAAIPGVETVGINDCAPFSGSTRERTLVAEGRSEPGPPTLLSAVSADYFRALAIPLLAGRTFTANDRQGAPAVAIANQSFVRQYFPDQQPLGRRVQGEGEGWLTIVGIARDTRPSPELPPAPELYVPYQQVSSSYTTALVRTAGDPMALAPLIRSQVLALDPKQPPHDFMTLDDRRARSIGRQQVNLLLVGTFAGLALALASIGIYGVVSHNTSQRTREIGIRMAMGADRADILSLIAGRAVLLVLAGEAAGVLLAAALTRVLAGFVSGVPVADPATCVAVALFWLAVALLACYLPARRASRLDPTTALRAE
jgi:putative ABC transport system permease protein